jgi:hypothetical protein
MRFFRQAKEHNGMDEVTDARDGLLVTHSYRNKNARFQVVCSACRQPAIIAIITSREKITTTICLCEVHAHTLRVLADEHGW